MKIRINYANDAERPELVALCNACTADECEGLCDNYRNSWRRIHGYPILARTDPNHKQGKTYLYQGEMLTIKEISQRTRITRPCLYYRLRRGMSIDDAVSTPVSGRGHRSNITYHGETRPIGQWARMLGINHSTLYRRINRGMPIDEAMSPLKKRDGRPYKLYEAHGDARPIHAWAAESGYTINSIKCFLSRGMTMEAIIERGKNREQKRKATRKLQAPPRGRADHH